MTTTKKTAKKTAKDTSATTPLPEFLSRDERLAAGQALREPSPRQRRLSG